MPVLWRIDASRIVERAADGGLLRERTLTLAGSYDDLRFTTAIAPAFSGRSEPEPDAPSLVFERRPRTWLSFSGTCGSAPRGIRVAVYPAEGALPIEE